MQKILFAAAALVPLFGGVALAQRPEPSSQYDMANGVTAYPDWAQRWAQLGRDPAAQLLGLSTGLQTPAVEPVARGVMDQGSDQPRG